MSSNSESMPTIEVVLRRRHLLSQSRHSLLWATINGLSIILLVIEWKFSIIGSFLDSKLFEKLVLILDLIIGSILLLNVFYNLFLWFWKNYLMIEIELTFNQMKAFGVKPNEIGFKQCKPNTPSPNDSILNRSFGSVTPPFEMSYSSDLDRHSSLNSTHLSLANTTGLSNAWNSSQMDSSLNTTSTSWEYNRNTNLNTSVNSPDHLNDSNSGYIRLRRNQNRIGYQSFVTNQTQLNQYLKDFEIKEQKQEELVDSEKLRQSNVSNNDWNSPVANNTSEDSNQNTYQIAIDSPLRLNSSDFDSVNTSATFSKAMDSLLSKLNINEMVLNQWIENIRKWISQTIICRLIEQIDKINESLEKSGHFDALIGEASLETLKQLSGLKKPELSTLDTVLPFIELTSNQHYFVRRIRDLSRGGCMGKFVWNSGASYNLKPWTQELLTDSTIVLHLFRTYMDIRLPSDPNFPEGKSFTNLYYKSMTGTTPKSPVYLCETKTNPPHYEVFIEGDGLLKLPVGRNNLFHAILVFLDAIKTKQLGHLGRINLGSSGLNILWVIQR